MSEGKEATSKILASPNLLDALKKLRDIGGPSTAEIEAELRPSGGTTAPHLTECEICGDYVKSTNIQRHLMAHILDSNIPIIHRCGPVYFQQISQDYSSYTWYGKIIMINKFLCFEPAARFTDSALLVELQKRHAKYMLMIGDLELGLESAKSIKEFLMEFDFDGISDRWPEEIEDAKNQFRELVRRMDDTGVMDE